MKSSFCFWRRLGPTRIDMPANIVADPRSIAASSAAGSPGLWTPADKESFDSPRSLLERSAGGIGERQHEERAGQEERRGHTQRRAEAEVRHRGQRADRVRRERTEAPADVESESLAGRSHRGREQLGEKPPEHAEVAVADEAEDRPDEHE